MNEVSRRGFIARASVVGAAAAVGVPTLASSANGSQTSTSTSPPADLTINGSVPDDVVVHIRDASTAEVAIIAGDEEYVYQDARLVSSVYGKFSKSTKE